MSKLRNKDGFTLVEMLIVVAIVAILIAISIPMVGNALERSREATDAANERAFKAALVTAYLQGDDSMGIKVELGIPYCYDAANGKICANANGLAPYGQGTAEAGQHKANGDHKDCYLWGHIGNTDQLGNTDESVYLGWSKSKEMTKVTGIDISTLTGPWLTLNS